MEYASGKQQKEEAADENSNQKDTENHKSLSQNVLFNGTSSSSIFHRLHKVQHVDEQQRAVRDRVWVCCWHHNGQILATAGEDRTIKIWKIVEEKCNPGGTTRSTTLQPHSTLRGDQTRSIRWLCFSPCGRFLAAASFDATILIYEYSPDTGEWEERHRLEGHESEVKCCAYSISGHYLASCSRDKSVWVWKADDEEECDDYEVLSILQQHTADVKFVVWNPREDILLSGGYDCSIRFSTFDGDDWTTAQAIQNAHDETIWSAAFEPTQGRHLATVGGDKAIKIWTRGQEADPQRANWRPWRKAVDLQISDTRWPLYSVSWSRPSVEGDSFVGTQTGVGLLAVGGGDRLVRIFSFDEDNEALILLGKVRMDSEINCLSWRPKKRDTENGDKGGEEGGHHQLAVALDDGNVNLLQIGG